MPPMKLPRLFAAALLSITVNAANAEAPLDVTNYATLARGFPLPVVGTTQVLAPDHDAYAATLDFVNEFHVSTNASETVRTDGETQRLSLVWRRGLVSGYEVSMEIP